MKRIPRSLLAGAFLHAGLAWSLPEKPPPSGSYDATDVTPTSPASAPPPAPSSPGATPPGSATLASTAPNSSVLAPAALAPSPAGGAPRAPASSPGSAAGYPAAPGAIAPRFVCLVHGAVGLSEEQFRGLQALLCDEVENLRGKATAGVPGVTERYRIELIPFGKVLLARLSWENPLGTIVATRSTQVGSIEMLLPSVLRLVRALQSREALTHQEIEALTPKAPPPSSSPGTRQGQTLVEFTLGGYVFRGAEKSGVNVGLGFSLGQYFSPRWAWLTSGRLALKKDTAEDSSNGTMIGVSMGMRHLGADRGLVPFLGGGVSASLITISPPGWNTLQSERNTNQFEGGGLGAYAEGGVGLFVNSRGGAQLGLRLDLPFFKVRQDPSFRWNPSSQPGSSNVSTPILGSSLYVVPISLSLSGQFH